MKLVGRQWVSANCTPHILHRLYVYIYINLDLYVYIYIHIYIYKWREICTMSPSTISQFSSFAKCGTFIPISFLDV